MFREQIRPHRSFFECLSIKLKPKMNFSMENHPLVLEKIHFYYARLFLKSVSFSKNSSKAATVSPLHWEVKRMSQEQVEPDASRFRSQISNTSKLGLSLRPSIECATNEMPSTQALRWVPSTLGR